jgi:hypothetical protein
VVKTLQRRAATPLMRAGGLQQLRAELEATLARIRTASRRAALPCVPCWADRFHPDPIRRRADEAKSPGLELGAAEQRALREEAVRRAVH